MSHVAILGKLLTHVTEDSTEAVAWKLSVQAPVAAVWPSSSVWKSSLSWQMLSFILLTVKAQMVAEVGVG